MNGSRRGRGEKEEGRCPTGGDHEGRCCDDHPKLRTVTDKYPKTRPRLVHGTDNCNLNSGEFYALRRNAGGFLSEKVRELQTP